MKRSNVLVGIDTSLAKEFEYEINRYLGIPLWLYDVKEGLYSFYVDCVDGKVASSSYSEEQYQFGDMNKLKRVLNRIDKWNELKHDLFPQEAVDEWLRETEEGVF